MKSFLIIGLGRFGRRMCEMLSDMGHEVLAVDEDESRVDAVANLVTNAQIGDCTDEKFLRSLEVDSFDECIVTIGDDFQASLETTSQLKELGARHVISRASRDVQEKFLLRNGADEVVFPERQVADWLSIRASSEKIFDYFSLGRDYAIFEVAVPKEWAGKTVAQLDIRRKYDINVLAVKRGAELDLTVTSETLFEGNENILIAGRNQEVIRRFADR